jgi:hypothetical protein
LTKEELVEQMTGLMGQHGTVAPTTLAEVAAKLTVADLKSLSAEEATDRTLSMFGNADTIAKADWTTTLNNIRASQGLPKVPQAVLDFVY